MIAPQPLFPDVRSESPAALEIGLNAAITSVEADDPRILTVRAPSVGAPGNRLEALPYGPFDPFDHRTLDSGLRSWVMSQTGLGLGYVEQLYTFADRGRHAVPGDLSPHVVSIGYVALTRMPEPNSMTDGDWRNWYAFFPWEDFRRGRPEIIEREIAPRLRDWACRPDASQGAVRALPPLERVRLCFGLDGVGWDEEKVLDRYELLYEAGLVAEAAADSRPAASNWSSLPSLGQAMLYDHRRILATAMGRLRGKIKYRPVIFELMPEAFTLFELQKTVEAILGSNLHKQNFRRLVENGGLVEPNGEVRTKTGGRPAKLFRFRREVLMERPAPGVRVHAMNAA